MSYSPGNNHGGGLDGCLKHKGNVAVFKDHADNASAASGHKTYVFFENDAGDA